MVITSSRQAEYNGDFRSEIRNTPTPSYIFRLFVPQFGNTQFAPGIQYNKEGIKVQFVRKSKEYIPDKQFDQVSELFNMLAWTCGFSSEPTLSEYVPIEGKNSTKLTSIDKIL